MLEAVDNIDHDISVTFCNKIIIIKRKPSCCFKLITCTLFKIKISQASSPIRHSQFQTSNTLN